MLSWCKGYNELLPIPEQLRGVDSALKYPSNSFTVYGLGLREISLRHSEEKQFLHLTCSIDSREELLDRKGERKGFLRMGSRLDRQILFFKITPTFTLLDSAVRV